jgi:hypothetical protein
VEIPLDRIREGIELCLQNSSQFCSDAEALARQESFEHALGLCILALEELGKAMMLNEMADKAKKNSKGFVIFEMVKLNHFFKAVRGDFKQMGFRKEKVNPFYDHPSKLLFAIQLLSIAVRDRRWKESLEGRFFKTSEEAIIAIKELDKPLPINPTTDLRELCFYIDYNEKKKKWATGVKDNFTEVKNLPEDIRKAIEFFKNKILS